MIVFAVCVFGFVSYKKLPLTLMPDVSYPTLTVRTEYPGSAPQEVESQVSERLEQQLAIIQGLNRITSISKADQSDILLEFAWGTNMNDATQDIREKVDRVRLPNDAKRPLILRYDPTLDPIMRIGLTGPYALDQLRIYAEDVVQRDLEGEEGIAAVQIKGGLEEEYQVRIFEDRLVALNLDIQTVSTRLAQNNVNQPGGRLKEGRVRYSIRTLNEFKSVEDIESIVVAQKSGVDIYLRDIGVVEKSHKEREIVTLVNGRESVEIEIYKDADANIVEVAQRVRELLYGSPVQIAYLKKEEGKVVKAEAAPQKNARLTAEDRRKQIQAERIRRQMTNFVSRNLPDGSTLEVLTDQSIFIKQSIDEVKGNAIVGGLIAVGVIFVFLRKVWPTIIIGITIPVSIVATFAPMQLAGVSLNIISLGGLALGVGMLVDNSIVVLESIFRCREEGDSFVDSVVRGTAEVGGAVVASTLTTIAVFFPIVFVEGVAGQIFGDMSLTVVFSLMASLVVALYFIPMLASRNFGEGLTKDSKVFNGLADFSFFADSWRKFARSIRIYHSWIKEGNLFVKAIGCVAYIPILVFLAIALPFRMIMCIAGRLIAVVVVIGILSFWVLGFPAKIVLKAIQPVLYLFDKTFAIVVVFYRGLLNWALDNKMFIVGGTFLSFLFTVYFMVPRLGSELIPQVHQAEFNLEVKLPVGTPIERTWEVVKDIESRTLTEPAIARTAVTVGTDGGATSDSDEGEHSGVITARLHAGSSKLVEEEVMNRLREYASNIPDVEMEVTYPELFSVKAPIEVEIYGYELSTLKDFSQTMASSISAIPGIVDVNSSFQKGNPEVQLYYDRQRLAQLGLQLKNVAELVRNKVQGQVPTEFQQRDRQIDILVRLDEKDRFSLEELKGLSVNPRGSASIPLSAIAEMKVREGPNEIRHLNQQRGAVITANVDGIDLSDAIIFIEEAFYDAEMPPGFAYEITGQAAEMDRSLKSLLFALGLALFLVYIVMASKFESLVHPFIILFSVPLAIIGVVWALFLLESSINILVFIGLIMLAGIVVNNAIVLVDYINNLRRNGNDKLDAVKTACHARFRPILMTTMTTVLGLVPMAMGLGEGSEIRTPLAITVISGLTASTFLTLVVIPSVYLLIDRKKDKDIVAELAEQKA